MTPSKLAYPLALAALVSLSGCGTISGLSGQPAPIAAPLTCPASLSAVIDPEPLPPEGIDPATIPPALSEFLWGSWLPWARGNTVRLDQGARWCKSKTGPPPDG